MLLDSVSRKQLCPTRQTPRSLLTVAVLQRRSTASSEHRAVLLLWPASELLAAHRIISANRFKLPHASALSLLGRLLQRRVPAPRPATLKLSFLTMGSPQFFSRRHMLAEATTLCGSTEIALQLFSPGLLLFSVGITLLPTTQLQMVIFQVETVEAESFGLR